MQRRTHLDDRLVGILHRRCGNEHRGWCGLGGIGVVQRGEHHRVIPIEVKLPIFVLTLLLVRTRLERLLFLWLHPSLQG